MPKLESTSHGDSEAWLVDHDELAFLSEGQRRKPLLGGGDVEPHAFTTAMGPTQTLLLAIGGSSSTQRRISTALRRVDLSLEEVGASLIQLVRLPRGGLQDDVGLVIVRHSDLRGRHAAPS